MESITSFGAKISLISKSEIRYEGVLHTIDPKESTIALSKVRSFGTESRQAKRRVPPLDEIFEFIIFRNSDIKDLVVDEAPAEVRSQAPQSAFEGTAIVKPTPAGSAFSMPLNSNFLHTDRRMISKKFIFPSASQQIVKRISDIILKDDSFYKDILLLMIQHNLQPPFDDVANSNKVNENENIPNIPSSYMPFHIRFQQKISAKRLPELSSKIRSEIPIKRSKPIPKENRSANIIDLFEKTTLKSRNSKILINIPLPKSSSKESESQDNLDSSNDKESFGKFPSTSKDETNFKKVPTTSQFDLDSLSPTDLIPESELMSNRITREEWSNFPVFSNYLIGEASQSLYIKNLNPRKVVLRDLYKVYSSFIDHSNSSQRNSFDIILLKAGKLRGQAFVSFPTIEIASKALQTTNGYLLNGKPMVVSFSRTKKPLDHG